MQTKNINSSNIVFANVAVNSTNSGRPISTKNIGVMTNIINTNKNIPLSSGLKIKVPEKINSEKENSNITPSTPIVSTVKGLKIEVTQSQRLNNDVKGKK